MLRKQPPLPRLQHRMSFSIFGFFEHNTQKHELPHTCLTAGVTRVTYPDSEHDQDLSC
ncbi:hypothetical protein [Ehrlichia muris]|uniref:hypothetical protein n=1 Tax=Ehrlichia muris TaxID=35795 RepID=UPI0037BEB44E